MECVGDVVHSIVELLYKFLQQRAYKLGAGAGGDGSAVAPPLVAPGPLQAHRGHHHQVCKAFDLDAAPHHASATVTLPLHLHYLI